MIRILRDLWLFFWRDLTVARTYRISFVLEIVEALFGTAMFYYVGLFVDSPQLRQALPQGGTYFAFSLVGFVFLDYMNASLDTFDRSLEEARNAGTLEHLLVTQTSLPVIVAGSALYPFAATTLRIAVYLAWGALLFGFPLESANWLTVGIVLLATLLAFPPAICSSSSAAIPPSGSCSASRALPAACFFPSVFSRTGCNSWRASIPSLTLWTPCAPRFSLARDSPPSGARSRSCCSSPQFSYPPPWLSLPGRSAAQKLPGRLPIVKPCNKKRPAPQSEPARVKLQANLD